MSSTSDRDEQALRLLEASQRPAVRGPLLGYARTLCGGDQQAAEDLYYQACLDAHDYVAAKGHAGEDYRFLLQRIIQRRHVDELRRQGKLRTLPEAVAELPDVPPVVDEVAHLAQQVAAHVQQEFAPADRVLLRLHAEGYSSRVIELMTGRNYRTVQNVVSRMLNNLRAEFGSMWDAL